MWCNHATDAAQLCPCICVSSLACECIVCIAIGRAPLIDDMIYFEFTLRNQDNVFAFEFIINASHYIDSGLHTLESTYLRIDDCQ
jgi:hypothetical protein